jgi:hypothetical protein
MSLVWTAVLVKTNLPSTVRHEMTLLIVSVEITQIDRVTRRFFCLAATSPKTVILSLRFLFPDFLGLQ